MSGQERSAAAGIPRGALQKPWAAGNGKYDRPGAPEATAGLPPGARTVEDSAEISQLELADKPEKLALAMPGPR